MSDGWIALAYKASNFLQGKFRKIVQCDDFPVYRRKDVDALPKNTVSLVLQVSAFGCSMVCNGKKAFLRQEHELLSHMIDPEIFAHPKKPKLKRRDLPGQRYVGLYKSVCHNILGQFRIGADGGGVKQSGAVIPVVQSLKNIIFRSNQPPFT